MPDSQEIIEALIFALEGAGCAVTVQDQQLLYLHKGSLASVWTSANHDGTDDKSIFGSELGEKLVLAKQTVLATGQQQKLSAPTAGRVFHFVINPMISRGGLQRIVTTVQDITKVRRREAAMRTLLLEVSHRSKNLLAIVQGLASQSAKHAHSLAEFMSAFNGRLHAVSAAQDVMIDSNWQGASLHELAKRQLAIVAADRDMNIVYQGDDLELDANQSLHAGLALHELAMLVAMNPVPGRRRITIGSGVSSQAFIQWKSEPGPSSFPLGQGFGPLLLEKVVPAALSGTGIFRAEPQVVEWRVDFPLKLTRPAKLRKLRHQ